MDLWKRKWEAGRRLSRNDLPRKWGAEGTLVRLAEGKRRGHTTLIAETS